jgi:hypothetical protein
VLPCLFNPLNVVSERPDQSHGSEQERENHYRHIVPVSASLDNDDGRRVTSVMQLWGKKPGIRDPRCFAINLVHLSRITDDEQASILPPAPCPKG